MHSKIVEYNAVLTDRHLDIRSRDICMVTPKHLYAQYKMPQVKVSFHDFDAGLGVGLKLISQELDAAVVLRACELHLSK